jgi:hypothetical protein
VAAIAIPTGLGLDAAVVIVTGYHVRNSAITRRSCGALRGCRARRRGRLRMCERLLGLAPRIQLDAFTAIADTGIGTVR